MADSFVRHNYYSKFPNLYVIIKQKIADKIPKIHSKEQEKPGKITKTEPSTKPKIKK